MTTEEVKQAIETLAAMTTPASITPEVVAAVMEKLRNLNDTDLSSITALLKQEITRAKNAEGKVQDNLDELKDNHPLDIFLTADEEQANNIMKSVVSFEKEAVSVKVDGVYYNKITTNLADGSIAYLYVPKANANPKFKSGLVIGTDECGNDIYVPFTSETQDGVVEKGKVKEIENNVTDLAQQVGNINTEESSTSTGNDLSIQKDDGTEVVNINDDGINVVNGYLQKGGVDVLTEHQDISGKADKTYVDEELAKKMDSSDNITTETPESSNESIDFTLDDDTVVLSIDKDGIKVPNGYVPTKNIRKIPMYNFKMATISAETWTDSDEIASSSSVICVPISGGTYYFHLPSAILCSIIYSKSYKLNQDSGWIADEGSFTIPEDAVMCNIRFKRNDSTAITIEELQNYIDNGELYVYYKEEADIIERNTEQVTYAKAAMMSTYYADDTALSEKTLNDLPVLVHVSDLHGDAARFYNAMDFAEKMGADVVVSSGDQVCRTQVHDSLYLDDIDRNFEDIKFINCFGNHECRENMGSMIENSLIYERNFAPYATRNSYMKDAETACDNGYYYVDIDAKKIRIITLNQYDRGCYWGGGSAVAGGRLGQEQVTWFCNTLLSTPSGYGVVVVMHSPEDGIDTEEQYDSFNQSKNYKGEDRVWYGTYCNSIRPIKKIVDAFISKEASFSLTYNENTTNGNTGEEITVNADFSEVAGDVEFICYMTGHKHADCIGYVSGCTNHQLMLNITCSNAHYARDSAYSFSEGSDLPREANGTIQDSFNMYAIDRHLGTVKIARIGSNVNSYLKERKYISISYK